MNACSYCFVFAQQCLKLLCSYLGHVCKYVDSNRKPGFPVDNNKTWYRHGSSTFPEEATKAKSFEICVGNKNESRVSFLLRD